MIHLRDDSRPIRVATLKIAPPELTIVPPCRDCGKVPSQYARFDDGSVQCSAASRITCYATEGK